MIAELAELERLEEDAVERLVAGQPVDEKPLEKARQAARQAQERQRLESLADGVRQARQADAAKLARIAELKAQRDVIAKQDAVRKERFLKALENLAKVISEEFETDDQARMLSRLLVDDLDVPQESLPGLVSVRALATAQGWQWEEEIALRVNANNRISIVLPIHGALV